MIELFGQNTAITFFYGYKLLTIFLKKLNHRCSIES